MRVYQVGGSVRDALIGLPVTDRDWVVVGASPAEMEREGFQPVGKDFPVFLHPGTKEEYALARTERKTARGYKGFSVHASPEVTLEEDLARRDLTINAMARGEDGALIDPFGGERDLRAGILRHVSTAFVEDPVRILRVARFAARFGFSIAPETAALMQTMVSGGEAEALVAERVWQEFSRGLMEKDPWRMLAELAQCGYLSNSYPALAIESANGLPANPNSDLVARALAFAEKEKLTLAVRFALVTRGARERPDELDALCEALRVPAECRELAVLASRQIEAALRADSLAPAEMLALVEASDAFRRPGRLDDLMGVAEAQAFAARHWAQLPFAPRYAARAALAASRHIDAQALAAHGGDIGARIRAARYANLLRTIGGAEGKNAGKNAGTNAGKYAGK
ncbi:MAG: multifunctional CCA tRNA nucleotidyl transferase/2'3'-cyclic phosphodiesterase/2'nucleotidase/phosphatase [Betaproteobacteria bacterium]|nr:multifunctional CCA tRNA nucleotidyl transferase/2'3'-cyclic phosphodiesterase/2'nucleotidase/phosphatase [Betaproteobacteria bacterium]